MAIDSRYKLKTGEEVAYFPPVQNTDNPYLTEAAMHADQAKQLKGYVYVVADVGHFEYKGGTSASGEDYKAMGSLYNPKKEILIQDKDTLTGALRSDVAYIIDGQFTLLTGEYINIPTGGLTMYGHGFDISKVFKDVAGEPMLKSVTGGSGNLIIKDTEYNSGASSVFDIQDATGQSAIEINDTNFIGCSSLGVMDSFRQFTGTTCGFYGCDDGLTLEGSWSGFKLANSNVFGFATTGEFIKQGAGLSFSSRFYLQLKIEFLAGSVITDFMPSIFLSKELFQINSCSVSVDGVIDDAHAVTLIPNISANNEKCLWRSNVGLPDSALEKFINDDAVTGTYDINWLVDTYFLTMTGDTTFTESHLPANLKNTEEIKIYLQGDFTPTFPADWLLNRVGTFKTGEINQITLKFIKNGVYFMKIDNSLTIYPAPDLSDIVPLFLPPNLTSSLTLLGSFFTPATVVKIEGQTIFSKNFVNSGQIDLVITAGSVEDNFDIEISNGTNVVYKDKLPIIDGIVTIPNTVDWFNIVEPIEIINDIAKTEIYSNNSQGSADIFANIPTNVDFSIVWNIEPTDDNPTRVTNNGSSFMSIRSQVDSRELYKTDVTNTYDESTIWENGTQVTKFYNGQGGIAYPGDGDYSRRWGHSYRFKRISGQMKFYVDNVLKWEFTGGVVNEAMFARFQTSKIKFTNIKYIEHP